MNNNDEYIMDWVIMANGTRLTGVLDFVSDRFIHFFNFDLIEDDPTLVLAAVVWKAKYSHIRFSVFCSTYYPSLKIPRVNLINRRGISEMSCTAPKNKEPEMTRIIRD